MPQGRSSPPVPAIDLLQSVRRNAQVLHVMLENMTSAAHLIHAAWKVELFLAVRQITAGKLFRKSTETVSFGRNSHAWDC